MSGNEIDDRNIVLIKDKLEAIGYVCVKLFFCVHQNNLWTVKNNWDTSNELIGNV